ncbi:TPA: enoyl-ACP reductase FabI [Listeria monocytogenes]|uniref:Enoyl-[acyl-carrier-protein] reductase [NADH] n=1 Tax=Listeria monocytogenes TaxID=1639 RepID=A0A9P1ZTZ0_LISMN|nr:enoyl-ACP reductase FabI [Listeria monocytogenes]EEP3937768.1 enoyl-ACP reductase FabI [Listeria monocytogenes serotype 1/2b]EAA0098767.1 enoyl-[acyl-carrier-protein] reductase FabI [Listeria monocytogenes]EAA0176267.1 enoyl-[acyl-carrier-protein] reductase FabI [Listeria monocytogenes]EAC2220798.1 enoyl-[acyl-carrier-protein] reductase FabI [Listeria monocytogenes]EAC2286325.1 enoyl-[acyl-carrier-protein] reductase FabI [Listeria monocytogenes]
MNLSLEGKTYVVMGVANKRSIAWAIARSLNEAGAKLVFTYADDRAKKSITELVLSLSEVNQNPLILACDVTSEEAITETFETIKDKTGKLSGLAHCIAFANKDFLTGDYLEVDRKSFLQAHEISAYSFTAVARALKHLEMLTEDASLLTLTYLGGERVVENYNIMGVAKASLDASVRYLAMDLGAIGVRVNAISAGPIRTVSARGVSGFSDSISLVEERAPLKRATQAEEVGDTAYYLFSNLSRGVTGEVIHVDSGYHIIGF